MNSFALSKRGKFSFLYIKAKRKPHNVMVVQLASGKAGRRGNKNILARQTCLKTNELYFCQ
jgi:hypothetical protein